MSLELIKESTAIYKLSNNAQAIGVATLIKNEDATENQFRMIGSIAVDNDFIEIVPILTKDQQERKRRSAEPEYDAGENTHLVETRENQQFTWTEPLRPGML